MPSGGEAGRRGDLVKRRVQCGLDRFVEGEVGDIPTARANEVVMVPRNELGEFEAGVVVAGNDSGHRSNLFENREVSVHTRLRQRRVALENLRQGERAITSLQCCNDATTASRVALVSVAEQRRYLIINFSFGHEVRLVVVGVVEDELVSDPNELPAKGTL